MRGNRGNAVFQVQEIRFLRSEILTVLPTGTMAVAIFSNKKIKLGSQMK
jgi:hypothetical protein